MSDPWLWVAFLIGVCVGLAVPYFALVLVVRRVADMVERERRVTL